MISRDVAFAMLDVITQGGRIIAVEEDHEEVHEDLHVFAQAAGAFPIQVRRGHSQERVIDPITGGMIIFTTIRSVAHYGGMRGFSADVVYLGTAASRGGIPLDAADSLRACLMSSPIGVMIAA